MSTKMRYRLRPTDAAYIAGLIDGEGCVRLNKSQQGSDTYFHIAVRVAMKDAPSIELLAKKTRAIGGKVYELPTKFGPVYRWQLTGLRALVFLESIYRYLLVKKGRAELCMSFEALKQLGEMSTENCERYYQRLRKLNEKRKSGARLS